MQQDLRKQCNATVSNFVCLGHVIKWACEIACLTCSLARVLTYFVCLRILRACLLACLVCLPFYLIISLVCILLKVYQLKFKCILTGVNLKVEKLKNINKYQENLFRYASNILQCIVLYLTIHLESLKWVCDNFGKLNCQVYLKAVTYIDTEKTGLGNEQKKLWNLKHFYKW